MKWVDARLSTGEIVTIYEEWFVRVIDEVHEWTMCKPPEANFGSGMVARVNPKFIVWARVMEKT